MARHELLQQLVRLQDDWPNQDILTITGFMSDDEVAAHVERYRELVARRHAA